jgi:uncharacterized coiled-coil protein SlyX
MMAMSLLAGGKQVPARQKPAQQTIAHPVAQPAKPIELATPAWLQPLLERIAAAEEREEQKPEPKDDDQALVAATTKLQQNMDKAIDALTAQLVQRDTQIKRLQDDVQALEDRMAKLSAPAVTPTLPWDTIRVIRDAAGFMRDLKPIKE